MQPNDQNFMQGSVRNSFINPFINQQEVKMSMNNQNANFHNLIDQNIPINIQRTESQYNSPLLSIHNQPNKVQFVHHVHSQPQPQQYLPPNKQIKIRINSPSTSNSSHIVNIQQ